MDRGARPAEVVALDQDVESLDHVVTTYHQDAVTARRGTVFIANFTPDTPDIGFMEAITAWHLIYRTEAEMLDVIQQADVTRRVADVRTWRDPDGCIVFAEMHLSNTAYG